MIDRHQIFAVTAPGGLLRRVVKSLERHVALPQRDLFRAGVQPLTLFQDLNEMTGLDQRRMRSGIEPGEATAENFHKQVAAFEIGLVNIGDLYFTAG
jgi:hypothetical protein